MGQHTATGERGFTLLELMIVVTLIGILATIAEPAFITATTKAREAALKRDLYIVRDVLDQYYADHGAYPATLGTLAADGYLRAIPPDPLTRSAETWQVVYGEGGVFDIHSGSNQAALDGSAYSAW